MGKKFGIEFDGMDQLIERMKKLEGDVKGTTEKALKETHSIVTKYAEISAESQNLPAEGRFSTGKTHDSVKRKAEVEWVGTTASIDTGFDIAHGGLPSIFMMYGTPRYMKNQKMYDAFYSSKTLKEVQKAQEEIFYDELRKLE
ncbi:hypothetical protein [Priestia megaterium]|uniref:hypothetical protein n=1 Tax=Priestia megaterium TaxID=1404 RepID=UPI002E1FE055|nr:hypothetical protein [Priestia megaterium]